MLVLFQKLQIFIPKSFWLLIIAEVLSFLTWNISLDIKMFCPLPLFMYVLFADKRIQREGYECA